MPRIPKPRASNTRAKAYKCPKKGCGYYTNRYGKCPKCGHQVVKNGPPK